MQVAADIIRPKPFMSCWDWNVANVDYSSDRSYKAATSAKYDPTLMPWWKTIVDKIDDPLVKEVVVLGISQGGKEEHCLCMPARYWAGTNQPFHVLYVGHQETKAEEIFIDRVKGSMTLTEATRNLLGTVRERGMVYDIGATRFACTHGGTGGGLKGKPWDRVLLSEISSFHSLAVLDEARKRGLTRPSFKIVMWGCPDWRKNRPSDEDPLFVEFDLGNRAEWSMIDPITGNRFFFTVGDGEGPGIHWDPKAKKENGSVDLTMVEETAYYVTPDGTRIDEKDRWKTVCTGEWLDQNEEAPKWKFSAHIHQLMMPWKDAGGFGYIARRFCESLLKGKDSHRIFRYEIEAAKWHSEKQRPEEEKVKQRASLYPRGSRFSLHELTKFPHIGKATRVIGTVDVQQDTLYWSAREWVQGGDSGLVDFNCVTRWESVRDSFDKCGVITRLIDASYNDRRVEVFDECIAGSMVGAIPCFGRDTLVMPFEIKEKDPYEGSLRQGRHKLKMMTWNPSQIKLLLMRLMNGDDPHIWNLPKDYTDEYIAHLTAEEYVDGAWVRKRKMNHWLDDEAMSLVGAIAANVYFHIGVEQQRPVAPVVQQVPRRGVFNPNA